PHRLDAASRGPAVGRGSQPGRRGPAGVADYVYILLSVRFRSRVGAVSRRKRLTGAHKARPSSRQGLKVAAAVTVPVMAAVAAIALVGANTSHQGSSPTSSSSTTTVTASKAAQAYQGKVDDAFRSLGDAVKIFLPKAQDFEAGKVAPADFKGAVDAALPEFEKARDAVAKLPKYKADPAVNKYFLDSADLYVETARIYGAATDPAADTLRAQLTLSARRVRTLGDRIYDRGRVVLDPSFYASSQNVELRPPTEVPDWVAEGMAAGPPLASAPGPPAATPPVRSEVSASKGVSAVKKAGLPQPADVRAAIDAADGARLGALAGEFEDKVRTLQAGPDPKKQRERAAVAGLGLLTAGESARLGQEAAMLPAGPVRDDLRAVARRCLVVGEGLLEPTFGFHLSGLPTSLLADTGPCGGAM